MYVCLQVESTASRTIERVMHHTRQVTRVVLTPYGDASVGGVWADNIRAVYSDWAVMVTDPVDSIGAAWNTGAQALHASACDVYVLMTADAEIDGTIIHVTDAASDASVAGMFVPLTNAPRLHGPSSSVYARRTDWQAAMDAAASALPITVSSCDGGQDSRVIAMHASTLIGIDFARTGDHVCVGSLHVVKSAYVWFSSVTLTDAQGAVSQFPAAFTLQDV